MILWRLGFVAGELLAQRSRWWIVEVDTSHIKKPLFEPLVELILRLREHTSPRAAEGRVTDVVTYRPSVERATRPTADGGRRAYLLEDPRHLDRDEAEGRDKWPRASCLRSRKAWY